MTVDISKIKVGDVVGVRVRCLGCNGVYMESGGWISFPSLVSHTPAPRPALKVGDRVVSPTTGGEWEIVFIQNTGHGYAHFAHKPVNALWPMRLDEVEQWERV